MKIYKHLLTAVLCATALSLTACAGAQTVANSPGGPAITSSAVAPTPDLLSDIDAKLANAAAIADAGGDAQGKACAVAAKAWADTLPIPQAVPVLPASIGISGDIETARIKVKAVQAKATALKMALAAGVPDNVTSACAVVVIDAETLAAKILGMIGLAPLKL